jgi:capsular polysaccharide biosynthesis protein
MKIFIKKILNYIISKLPVFVIKIFILLIQNNKVPNKNIWNIIDRIEFYLWHQIRNWPIKKIMQLGNLVKKYQLVNIQELLGLNEIVKVNGGIYHNYLASVSGICDGAEIRYNFENEVFYEISDVSFNLESDFIRKNDHVICEKLKRKDSTILVLEDIDYVAKRDSYIILQEKKNKIYLDNVFYITGVLSNFWSHFLISFFPRLSYLNYINEEQISIVIPYKLDNNIKQLIEQNILHRHNFKIIEVDFDTTIICKKFYYAMTNSYILCHSNHFTPFAIQISELTCNFILNNISRLTIKKDNLFRKLFIARKGLRNIENYDEIENYYVQLGYEIITPHLLNLEQKRKIFGEAKLIVGPMSSGFTNIIFCNTGVQILALTNYARCYDSYIGTLCKVWNFECFLFTGIDVDSSINSNYTINLEELNHFYKSEKFIKS